MDPTLQALLAELFRYSQMVDAMRQELAEKDLQIESLAKAFEEIVELNAAKQPD